MQGHSALVPPTRNEASSTKGDHRAPLHHPLRIRTRATVGTILGITQGTASAAEHKGGAYFGLSYGATATHASIVGKVEPFLNISG